MAPFRTWESLRGAVWTLLLSAVPVLAAAQGSELDSLTEVPAIQQLIREERQQGNAEAAWNLEQSLMRLALRNPDDARSARVLRDVGDNRVDTLVRYDAGEFPPEIVFGCYYRNMRQLAAASRSGSQPLGAAAGSFSGNFGCQNGSHRAARRALAEEALGLYVESARILVSSEQAVGDEVREILMKVLVTSYRNSDYRAGRWSLQLLLSHQEATSAPSLTKAQTLALMGDWDLLFARHFGKTYREAAVATYEQAIDLLEEHGVADNAVSSIFSPQTPILLPAFTTDRLVSQQTADSLGHVDVSFEIQESGKSARIEVVESSVDLPRSVVRDLISTIKHGMFRPIAANGRLLDSAPVTARYYISD
jgi:hypothetical protein